MLESFFSLSVLDYRKFHVTVRIEYYKKGKVYCQTCLITFLSKKKNGSFKTTQYGISAWEFDVIELHSSRVMSEKILGFASIYYSMFGIEIHGHLWYFIQDSAFLMEEKTVFILNHFPLFKHKNSSLILRNSDIAICAKVWQKRSLVV